MRPRIIVSIFLLIFGVVVALKPTPRYNSFELTAEELLYEATKEGNYISTDELADKLINNDPSIQLIDLRDKFQYDRFHLPGAINIPFETLLNSDDDDETVDGIDYIDQEVKQNIFYGNGTSLANKAWLLSKVEGFQNNYILQGGLNEWFSTILLVEDPGYEASAEAQELYSFRSAAKNFFTGGGIAPVASSGNEKKKVHKAPKKKKKKAAGGCG